MCKTKILVITPYLPYPLDAGGRVRQYNLLKRLASQHEITLVSFIDTPDELKYVSKVEEFCARVQTVLREQPASICRSKTMDRLVRLRQIIHSPFTRAPSLLIHSFDSLEMKSKIAELMAQEDFDLVQVDFTQMAKYLPESCKIPSILVEHDIMFWKYYRLFQVEPSPLTKTQALADYLKVKRFELEVCARYNKIVTMSDQDKNLLLKHQPDLDISVIPNGVDASYFGSTKRRITSRNLVFVGWMKNSPNIDAINYFHNQIFPQIKQQAPDVKLRIIGKEAPQALHYLRNNRSIEITGYVDDLRPYLVDCAAFIVPLRIASGTRLKILEAMAAGCPIVSTSIGAEGLDVTNRENILIADTPTEFAQAVVQIMNNNELQNQLGHNARILVQKKYDWEIIARLQSDLYAGMVNKNGSQNIQLPVGCPIPN